MAAKTELQAQTKKGVIYYAHDDGNGRLRAVRDIQEANATALGTYRWVQVGGIMVLTKKTEAELKARREGKRNKRAERTSTIVKRTRERLINHPDKEFIAAFAAKQQVKIEKQAKKLAKENMLAKAKALKEQANAL